MASPVLDAFTLARTSFDAAILLASHDPETRGIASVSYRHEAGVLAREA